MYRTVLTWIGVVVSLTVLTPIRSEAGIIQCFDSSNALCTTIGLFSWAPGSLGDDVFTLTNISDTSSLPPDDFESVSLILDGSTPAFPPDPVLPGAQVDSQGTGFFFATTSAHLAFTFGSAPFTIDLTADGDVPILAQAAPEPATLLLFGIGVLASRFLRRRHS